jgi:short-subunit dehydrogenase
MKKILITGCSTGFGFDAARYLAEKGHHVFATMRDIQNKNAAPASSLRTFASEQGLNMEVYEMDVTSDESVNKAVDQMPVIDVLINNAGLGYGGPVEAFSSGQCLAQLDLNIVGTIRVTKAVLPGMRQQKSGLIIQVGSTAGRGAFPGFGIYHASKWGLEGLSEAMRYELAPLGIDVSIVEPGPFSTNFLGNLVAPENAEVAASYGHVGEFAQSFSTQVMQMFDDKDAPTDPMIVVHDFEKLIDAAPGKRPLRIISGLDFGLQAINDATEPIRQGMLANMGIGEWDGAKA